MPVYEYCCQDCRVKFELLRHISQSDDKAACPDCGKQAGRAPSLFSSLSKGENGVSTPVAGGSSCSGCSAASCSSCGG